MKLSEWLKQNELTATAFAKAAGLDVSTVTRSINGQRRPEWDTLDKIRAATNGEVTPNDFIPDQESASVVAAGSSEFLS